MTEYLGFSEYIPPYANATSLDYFLGVNYASGSAGILNETGEQLGQRIPFDMQLENHGKVKLRLARLLGESFVDWYLGRCLYTVGLGNNDYINNYFVSDYYNTSQLYTVNEFTQLLIQNYTRQIKRLYSYGARKIAIFGLGAIGCTPNAISKYGNGTACYEAMDEAVVLFNTLLIPVVDQLNQNLTDGAFTYIDSYGIAETSADIGVTNLTSPCCVILSDGECIPNDTPCKNRTTYVFWDGFHTTEVFNKYTAQRSYQALYPTDGQPYDIRTLIQLNKQVSAI